MKEYVLEVELDISNITVKVVHNIEMIAKNYNCDVFHHGYDHLVIGFNTMLYFTKCINEISNMLERYNIDYVDLLI